MQVKKQKNQKTIIINYLYIQGPLQNINPLTYSVCMLFLQLIS